MPRIPIVEGREAGWWFTLAGWFAKRRYGAVPEPGLVMAHHPALLKAYSLFELRNERAARVLPASLRELVVYRVAVRLGCSWCVDFGTMVQRLKGLDTERLREIDDYPTSAQFTELEKLALTYADAVTDSPSNVTDEQVAELDRRLGHKGMVELTFAVALENMRARFNGALGITDQGFSKACAVQQNTGN